VWERKGEKKEGKVGVVFLSFSFSVRPGHGEKETGTKCIDRTTREGKKKGKKKDLDEIGSSAQVPFDLFSGG